MPQRPCLPPGWESPCDSTYDREAGGGHGHEGERCSEDFRGGLIGGIRLRCWQTGSNSLAYLCQSTLGRGHCCCLLCCRFDSRRAYNLDKFSANHSCRVVAGPVHDEVTTAASFHQVHDIGSLLGFSNSTPELLASAPLLRSSVTRGGKRRSNRSEACRGRNGICAVGCCQCCGELGLGGDQGCSSRIGDRCGGSEGEGVSDLGGH